MSNPEQNVAQNMPTTTGDIPAATTPKDGQKQILIVDNNPSMSRIVSRFLTKADLGYATAQSGEEAVNACEQVSYDLILMQINMPGIGGMEATKRIRELAGYAVVPIIAVSTKMAEADMDAYEKCGMNGALKKPVVEMNLMSLLGEVLDIDVKWKNRKPPEDDEIYAILEEDEMSLINWDTLAEYNQIMKGDYEKMMQDYLRVSPDLIGDLGEAIIDKNHVQIEFLAHKLKSTSLIFGAENVSNIAAQLEILGRENNLENAGQFYKELHMSFERVQPVLRKKLVIMKSANL